MRGKSPVLRYLSSLSRRGLECWPEMKGGWHVGVEQKAPIELLLVQIDNLSTQEKCPPQKATGFWEVLRSAIPGTNLQYEYRLQIDGT